jgi:predicted DNA-binding transcriptional regulator YafY
MSRGEPLIRQWNLLKNIQAKHFGITADELAGELECSKRQVQRDLNVLQDVGFPLRFEVRDLGKKFWRLDSRFLDTRQLILSVTEMLSLFLSREVLSPLAGTQFGDGLNTAIDKIKALLPDKAMSYFRDLDENLLVKSLAKHDYSGQNKQIQIINQAMSEGCVLKIRYNSASKKRMFDARFHPYGLVFFGMNLYCIGYLVEYEEVRTLKVVRFKGVELTSEKFERPASFSLSGHMQGAFGIMRGEKTQPVRVRFTGWAATNVREQTWHPSQKILKDNGNGRNDCVVAAFELSDMTEFKRWLLGFGRHAVVQTPKILAADIKAEFKASCGAYGIDCQGRI